MFVAKPNIIVEDPIMLHDRLVQMMRQATGRSKKYQEKMISLPNKEINIYLNETGSPTSVVSRKVLMEDSPQNVVADLNWDCELQLMKVAYEERGTPYHFCREDYQRNISGIPMNKHCQMMCVGPGVTVGRKQQHAIVTCGFNQQCCGKVIWGTKGNNQCPSVKERRLILTEAFNNVQRAPSA